MASVPATTPRPRAAGPTQGGRAVEHRARRRPAAGSVGAYLLLAVVTVLLLFPVYWMLTISLKIPREINRVPSLWPQTVTLDNYRELLGERGFLTNLRNSTIVAGSVTLVSLFISSLAAYSLVRFRYRFRGLVGRLILFGYLMPTSLLFIPLSIIVARLNLGNSLQGLIVVYLTFSMPLSTWLLTGYFRGVPAELEEQAMVDGATRMGALLRIVLPLSLPGLVAVGIFTFTAAWNELLLALIFITSEDLRTVPLALQYLITGDVYRWGPIMAGAVLSSLPVVILYFAAQRVMVQGATAGSVKG
ncbi:MAG: Maltose/maltodextrin ABC transporter, permease protein MalG [uncultured Thermomicrobiales bacterium]|uniref:Maltose/maltodextrin ABC transporter, permease protein MalG n=1 Tax=uncultured Thermomicrobiales bacterium TaxID=1645740 RepID=A0A6J4VE68_9BACT|nr:MAG: Maltose/maltodextrin ABC transporter, permease protein MalG [uncultured Thermomicrobiales bacterium]